MDYKQKMNRSFAQLRFLQMLFLSLHKNNNKKQEIVEKMRLACSQCHKQISKQHNYLCYAEIKHADWMLQLT